MAYESTVKKPACTKGSTSTAMTIPFSGPVHGRRVKSVRPSIFIESSSGNIEVRLGYQTSNDGLTWGATSQFSGYTTWVLAAGWTRGTTFASPTAAPYYRIVVEARNTSGTDMECALVTLLLEIKVT